MRQSGFALGARPARQQLLCALWGVRSPAGWCILLHSEQLFLHSGGAQFSRLLSGGLYPAKESLRIGLPFLRPKQRSARVIAGYHRFTPGLDSGSSCRVSGATPSHCTPLRGPKWVARGHKDAHGASPSSPPPVLPHALPRPRRTVGAVTFSGRRFLFPSDRHSSPQPRPGGLSKALNLPTAGGRAS